MTRSLLRVTPQIERRPYVIEVSSFWQLGSRTGMTSAPHGAPTETPTGGWRILVWAAVVVRVAITVVVVITRQSPTKAPDERTYGMNVSRPLPGSIYGAFVDDGEVVAVTETAARGTVHIVDVATGSARVIEAPGVLWYPIDCRDERLLLADAGGGVRLLKLRGPKAVELFSAYVAISDGTARGAFNHYGSLSGDVAFLGDGVGGVSRADRQGARLVMDLESKSWDRRSVLGVCALGPNLVAVAADDGVYIVDCSGPEPTKTLVDPGGAYLGSRSTSSGVFAYVRWGPGEEEVGTLHLRSVAGEHHEFEIDARWAHIYCVGDSFLVCARDRLRYVTVPRTGTPTISMLDALPDEEIPVGLGRSSGGHIVVTLNERRLTARSIPDLAVAWTYDVP